MTKKPILDRSDKGRKMSGRLRYEVGVFHTQRDDEKPVIVAKFQAYGDAYAYAIGLKNAPVFYEEIIIQD